jgi:hypothetical protein
MKPRARFLLGLWVLLAGIAMVLWAAQGDLFNALLTPAPGVFAGVAALILSRRPGNAVGSIMLAVPFLLTFSDVLKALFLNAQGRPHDTDVSRLLVWADSWLSFVLLGLVTIVLPLRFPDGRLPSPRWRPFLWGALAVVAAAIVGTAFGSPRSEWGDEKSVDNPWRWAGPRASSSPPWKVSPQRFLRWPCSARSPASRSASGARRGSSASSSSSSRMRSR